MELTTEDGTVIQDPGSDDLRAALGRLGLPGNGFAILAASPQHYIQVAGSKADGYVVEYREGSEATHRSSTVTDLPHPRMVELLTAYLSGGSWKSMVSWRATLGGKRSSRRSPSTGERIVVILFSIIGAISLAAGAYFAYSTHRFLARAVEVPGKVVSLVPRGSTYAPLVEYVDRDGNSRTLQSAHGSRPPAFSKGEEVTIVYDPADPEFHLTARISTFWQLWGGALFALAFGAGFGGIALAHWLILFRRPTFDRHARSAA